MRVDALVEQLLSPVPGGTGRYTAAVLTALAGVDGVQVRGWTALHRQTGAARLPGVAGPRRLPVPRPALAELWRRATGPGPRGGDVVYAPTPLAPPRRGRLVVTVHDAVPWTEPDTLTPRGAAWHRDIIGRLAAEADALTTPTQVVADALLAHLPQLDRSRLHVIGAGVSAGLRDPSAADHAVRRALPGRYAVAVGTLEPRKGLDVLVRALAAVPDLALVVVGPPGWGDVDLTALARAAGLPAGRVHATGRLADAALAGVLRGAQLLVAPSRSEGFGLPVAEALAVGTPVVASDIPAHREVAGDAARYAPPGDADALAGEITAVLHDDAERDRMRAAGPARAARFDWDAVAVRLHRVLAGAPPPPPSSTTWSTTATP